jgi:hypothetical protein
VESVYNWEDESAGAYNWEDEGTQADESADEPAEPTSTAHEESESVNDVGNDEASAEHSQAAVQPPPEVEQDESGDSTIAIERPESIMEQAPEPTPPVEDHRRADGHQQDWEAMGKALYHGGSGARQ